MSIAMQNEIDALRKRVEELEKRAQLAEATANLRNPVYFPTSPPAPQTLSLKRKNG